jgi:hopanoid biosynthesis associated protein HpnK
MACELIVNADDFGWSQGANAAIVDLFDAGIVTSTSLMVGAPAAEPAMELAQSRPELGVGLHLVLVHGPALLPREKIPHLVDDRGWFTRDFVRAGVRYTLQPACRREAWREAEAQFDRFARFVRESGRTWSHVDSHLHLALTPPVFAAMLALARRHPVVGLRVPEDDFALYRSMDPADAARQRVLATQFSVLCAPQHRRLRRSDYVVPQRCYGLFRTGRLDAAYLAALVNRLPEGLSELHCHPDLSTQAGKREHAALRSDEFRKALRERRVRLVSYPTAAAK